MAATLTAYNDALKRIWTQETLEEQLFTKTELWDIINATTKFRVGEVARTPLHVSRSGSYTALPDGGGNLNAAGNQGVAKAEWNYKHHHYQIAIQGDVLDQTGDNALAVANALDTEVNGALNDIRFHLQRQLFQNGDALVAQCGTTTATNVVQLTTAAHATATSGKNAIDRGWLYVGLPVDIGTTANEVADVDGETITAVSKANSTITVTSSITTNTSDFVSIKNARSGTTSYEMNGLRNVVSTSATVGGLAPTAQASWAAASVDTTAQALTLSLMLQQSQAIHQETGEEPDFALSGLKQSRKFYELLQQQVRYNSDSSISAGAQNKPTWNGMQIVRDPHCQDEDFYFGIKRHLFMVALDKPYWQNKVTGGQILDWIQGTDSYGAKLSYRAQLATNRRNAFARLGGLT